MFTCEILSSSFCCISVFHYIHTVEILLIHTLSIHRSLTITSHSPTFVWYPWSSHDLKNYSLQILFWLSIIVVHVPLSNPPRFGWLTPSWSGDIDVQSFNFWWNLRNFLENARFCCKICSRFCAKELWSLNSINIVIVYDVLKIFN